MTAALRPELPALMIEDQVRAALIEDLGRAGDITTLSTIGPELTATAGMNARDPGVVAGLDLARAAFRLVDPSIRFEALVAPEQPSPAFPVAPAVCCQPSVSG